MTVYGVGRDQGMTSGPTKAIVAAVLGRPYRVSFDGPTMYQYAGDVAQTLLAASRSSITGAHVFNLPGRWPTVQLWQPRSKPPCRGERSHRVRTRRSPVPVRDRSRRDRSDRSATGDLAGRRDRGERRDLSRSGQGRAAGPGRPRARAGRTVALTCEYGSRDARLRRSERRPPRPGAAPSGGPRAARRGRDTGRHRGRRERGPGRLGSARDRLAWHGPAPQLHRARRGRRDGPGRSPGPGRRPAGPRPVRCPQRLGPSRRPRRDGLGDRSRP